MQAFIEEYGLLLLGGVGETLFMTLVPTLFAYVLGLPMGVLLTITKPGGIAEAPRFNAVFGWLVNILRSLPFMILMIFIIPLTRFIAGTSIGATAACVPLTIAAAPFVARMVEQSLEEIDRGTVEAARCMGATNWQIVTRVLLVESVPSLQRSLKPGRRLSEFTARSRRYSGISHTCPLGYAPCAVRATKESTLQRTGCSPPPECSMKLHSRSVSSTSTQVRHSWMVAASCLYRTSFIGR